MLDTVQAGFEPEPASTTDPFLSVVATARNDGHGGDLLYRMQVFANALAEQCARHHLSAELILVEWNPPADRPSLAEVIDLPAAEKLPVRIVTVPNDIHARLEHSAELPLFQMIAKNVGIRRARGRFVLATNVDVIFDDELVETLAESVLSEDRVYRCDRFDVTADIPAAAPVEEQLELCSDRVIRINRFNETVDLRTGTVYPIYPLKLPPSFPLPLVIVIRIFELFARHIRHLARQIWHFGRGAVVKVWTTHKLPGVRATGARVGAWFRARFASSGAREKRRPAMSPLDRIRERWRLFVANCRALKEWEQARIMLHTNASGDFTLMSKRGWNDVRGYPELELFSMHLDSLLLYEAHYAGYVERCLPGRVYHLEHSSGFKPDDSAVRELNDRLDRAAVPQVTNDQFREWILAMFRQKAPIVFNDASWGFADEVFAEHGTATASPRAVVPASAARPTKVGL